MPKISRDKLVDSRVKNLKCGKRKLDAAPIPATYWDSEIRGFGVQVMPSGTKTFFYKYVSPVTKKQAWLKLGRYTGPASLAHARVVAAQKALEKDDGLDPKVEKRKAAERPVLSKTIPLFLEEHYSKRAPSTRHAATVLLEGIVVPEWGSLRGEDITHPMVQALFKKVSEGWRPGSKEKDPTATPVKANRLIAYLSKYFNWAEKNQHQPMNTNPCRHIEKNEETKRERYLSEEELVRLGKALAAAEQDHFYQVSAVRLLVFTGARLREITGLRWDQVSLQEVKDEHGEVIRDERGNPLMTGCITIKNHKTAKKTGTKVLPLSDQAVSVLQNLAKVTISPFVFPGRDPRKPLPTIQRFWDALRSQEGLDLKDVHLHDLRHTFGAAAVGEGISLRVAGSLLGHTQAQTTQRYAHASMNTEREATKKVGAKLGALLG